MHILKSNISMRFVSGLWILNTFILKVKLEDTYFRHLIFLFYFREDKNAVKIAQNICVVYCVIAESTFRKGYTRLRNRDFLIYKTDNFMVCLQLLIMTKSKNWFKRSQQVRRPHKCQVLGGWNRASSLVDGNGNRTKWHIGGWKNLYTNI